MTRRATTAALRNSTGEAYIDEEKGRNRYRLRLPKDLDPKRRKFFAPLTPGGLQDLAKRRDAMIAVLDERRAKEPSGSLKTVREVAEQYLAWAPVKRPKERRRILELYVLPTCGRMMMASLTHREVNAALDRLAERGLSQQTGEHVKKAVNQLVKFAYRRDLIASTDWLLKVELPRLKVDTREREALTDEEFEQFVLHPDVDLELKALAVSARCIGGARTSDLHAWRWEHIDLPSFATAHVPRPKTDAKKKAKPRVTVHDTAKHFLRQWWLACGRPEAGFVFGTVRPRRTGQGKKGEQRGRGTGYAARLRAALWSAGVRRHELHNDTDLTRRADFHSFRRAYNTAMADAGVNAQDAMQAAGHSDMATHMLYVQSRTVTTPDAVIPRVRLPEER